MGLDEVGFWISKPWLRGKRTRNLHTKDTYPAATRLETCKAQDACSLSGRSGSRLRRIRCPRAVRTWGSLPQHSGSQTDFKRRSTDHPDVISVLGSTIDRCRGVSCVQIFSIQMAREQPGSSKTSRERKGNLGPYSLFCPNRLEHRIA